MKYYLSVQGGDLEDARYVGSDLLSQVPSSEPRVDPSRVPTDPKLTHSGKNGPNMKTPERRSQS